MSDEYQISGNFAGNSINAFKRYVTDGVLDVEAVTKDYALNERQIPHLRAELIAAGYLKESVGNFRDTAPLPVVEEVEDEE